MAQIASNHWNHDIISTVTFFGELVLFCIPSNVKEIEGCLDSWDLLWHHIYLLNFTVTNLYLERNTEWLVPIALIYRKSHYSYNSSINWHFLINDVSWKVTQWAFYHNIKIIFDTVFIVHMYYKTLFQYQQWRRLHLKTTTGITARTAA